MIKRDTKRKSKPICNLCGEKLINKNSNAEYCKECRKTITKINHNQKRFMKNNKEIIEQKDDSIFSLNQTIEVQEKELVGLKRRIEFYEKKEPKKIKNKKIKDNVLICDVCKGRTKVIDSRVGRFGLRRRRECLVCKKRFSTYEILIPTTKK